MSILALGGFGYFFFGISIGVAGAIIYQMVVMDGGSSKAEKGFREKLAAAQKGCRAKIDDVIFERDRYVKEAEERAAAGQRSAESKCQVLEADFARRRAALEADLAQRRRTLEAEHEQRRINREEAYEKRQVELAADYRQRQAAATAEMKRKQDAVNERAATVQETIKNFHETVERDGKKHAEKISGILMKKVQDAPPPPPDMRLAHVLRGESLAAQFFVGRGGRVVIDWTAGLTLSKPPRVVAQRSSGGGKDEELFSDVAHRNRFMELIRPDSYLYEIAVYGDGGTVIEKGRYRLSVPSDEEYEQLAPSEPDQTGPAAPWERKVRDQFRSQVKLVRLVKELQQAAYAEIETAGLPEGDKEAAFARVDHVAATLLGGDEM